MDHVGMRENMMVFLYIYDYIGYLKVLLHAP